MAHSKLSRIAKNSANVAIFAIILLLAQPRNRVNAQNCYPSDPGGNNPQNPCPLYPPAGIRSDSFIRGHARPIRELPTVTNASGRVIAAPAGYWSGTQTENGIRSVKTNHGKTYRFSSQ